MLATFKARIAIIFNQLNDLKTSTSESIAEYSDILHDTIMRDQNNYLKEEFNHTFDSLEVELNTIASAMQRPSILMTTSVIWKVRQSGFQNTLPIRNTPRRQCPPRIFLCQYQHLILFAHIRG